MSEVERQIHEALQIGHANKRTLELVQNWCRHVSAEVVGGVGIIEVQTGLPIGMRGLNCPYATERGFGAMDLEAVALNFYDLNCASCKRRHALRLPNLSMLVAERDRRQERALAASADEQEKERKLLAVRRAQRHALAKGGETGRRSILERIDAFDESPDAANAGLLLETTRAISDKFDDAALDALCALIDCGGARARAAFEALSIAAKDRHRLENAALQMLAMQEAPELAAQVLGAGLASASPEQIEAALPAMFRLAVPLDGFGHTKDPVSSPLLSAWSVAPATVRKFLGELFHSDEKHWRIVGCRAAEILVQQDPSVGSEFGHLALASIGRPDNSYGPEGAASASVAAFLASALLVSFDSVDSLLQAQWDNALEKQRITIVDAYVSALRGPRTDQALPPEEPGRYVMGSTSSPGALTVEVAEKSFKRILDVASSRKIGDCFDRVLGFLRGGATHHLELVAKHSEPILGGAALLLEDLKDRYSPLLDPRPTGIKALEDRTRRSRLWSAVDALMELLGQAASTRPHVVELVLETLHNLDEGQDQLCAALTTCLGHIGRSRDGLLRILPDLYTGMLAREQVVRAAGARAYAEVARAHAEDLPRLLHESFLLLLQDPFVIVHSSAAHALGSTRLPEDLERRACVAVWALVSTYSTSHDDDSLLAECVETFIRLSRPPLRSVVRARICAIVRALPAYLGTRILKHHADVLEGVPEFGDALVQALRAELEDDVGSARNELLRCLRRLTPSDIARLAAELEGFAAAVHPGPLGPVDLLLEVVISAAQWPLAVRLARVPLARLLDVPRDRVLRSIVMARLTSLEIERATSAGDVGPLPELCSTWRKARAEVQRECPDFKWPLLDAFAARVDAVSALQHIAASARADAGNLADALERITTGAAELGDTASGQAYSAYAKLLESMHHLTKWADAVRRAEQDADRFLRAAKQAGKDAAANIDTGNGEWWCERVALALAAIERTRDLESIQGVASAMLAVSLPPPLEAAAVAAARKVASRAPEVVAPCIVFVSFTVDGVPLADPHVIAPDELHDLDVTVRVSRWPEGASLVLDALTVEPLPTVGELPRFTIDRPQGPAPHELRQGGRMLIRVAQRIAARPLEFVYRAYFLPEQPRLDVAVEGDRRIRVRSYDPVRHPVTGFPYIDLKLLEIRDQVRTFLGIQDRELDAFLLILKALGQMAGEALKDNTFPQKIAESEFQKRVCAKLRADLHIAVELEVHPHGAGGILDLSFRGIPIELKVEPTTLVSPDVVEGYSQQAAQYTAGNDRRLGVLCILDCSPKGRAPGSVADDIMLRPISPPSKNGSPLVLGVVVVQGNLPRPSSWSS
jgi:hypothetical protein